MTSNELSEIVDIACHSFIDLIRKRELVAVALKDLELRNSYNKSKAGFGFLDVTYILYADLIVETVSIIADQSNDTVSLARIIEQLEKKALHDYFRKEYTRPHVFNWSNKFDSESERIKIEKILVKRERRSHAASFRRIYENLLHDWARLCAMPEYSKLRKTRNKILSHKAIRIENGVVRLFSLKDFDVKYGDCERVIDVAEKLFVRIGTLVRHTDYGHQSAKRIYAGRAREFWITCRGKNQQSG